MSVFTELRESRISPDMFVCANEKVKDGFDLEIIFINLNFSPTITPVVGFILPGAGEGVIVSRGDLHSLTVKDREW